MGKTALLTLDLQVGIMALAPETQTVITPIQQALTTARERQQLVVHVGLGFTSTHLEIPEGFCPVRMAKDQGIFARRHPSAEFVNGLVLAGDGIVHKQRISAFSENALQMILRTQQIKHLVLCGITTSGVVLSSVRQAVDLDFELTVLRDGCWDPDPEVHEFLMNRIFVKQARVCSVAEWQKGLTAAEDGTLPRHSPLTA